VTFLVARHCDSSIEAAACCWHASICLRKYPTLTLGDACLS
jgi:hypothetical protein